MNLVDAQSEMKARGILNAPTLDELELRKYLSREWQLTYIGGGILQRHKQRVRNPDEACTDKEVQSGQSGSGHMISLLLGRSATRWLRRV